MPDMSIGVSSAKRRTKEKKKKIWFVVVPSGGLVLPELPVVVVRQQWNPPPTECCWKALNIHNANHCVHTGFSVPSYFFFIYFFINFLASKKLVVT